MIRPFITRAQRNAARRKSLLDHIKQIELRHAKLKRHGSVELLKKLLSQIPKEKDDLQAKPKIQTEI